MSVISTSIIKRLSVRSIFGTILFIVPAYAIKWGRLHPHINWPHYLQTAWAVGLANSPLAHHEFYTAHFHWQELACLFIYLLVSLQAEYLLAAYGGGDPDVIEVPRTRKQWQAYFSDGDRLVWAGTNAFLFLYVAACALCERTQMGTITASASLDSIIRDTGIVLVTYFLFKAMIITSESVTFNGMVVRTDIERIYNLVIYSLMGMALTFSSWFPLLAIPGARIATKWIFARLRETMRTPESQAQVDRPEKEAESASA